jgi:hypothetical protein
LSWISGKSNSFDNQSGEECFRPSILPQRRLDRSTECTTALPDLLATVEPTIVAALLVKPRIVVAGPIEDEDVPVCGR